MREAKAGGSESQASLSYIMRPFYEGRDRGQKKVGLPCNVAFANLIKNKTIGI